MLRGVHTHVCVSPFPIDLPQDRFLQLQRRAARAVEAMEDRPPALGHLAHADGPAPIPPKRPFVAGLSPAGRIEERAIEDDPAGRQGRDPGGEPSFVRRVDVRQVGELRHSDAGHSPFT